MSYNARQLMGRINPTSFRMMPEELERLDELVAYKKRKYHSVDRSKIILELIGLDPPAYLTEQDRKAFILGMRFDTVPEQQQETGYLMSFGKPQAEKEQKDKAERVIKDTIQKVKETQPPDFNKWGSRKKTILPVVGAEEIHREKKKKRRRSA